MLMRKLFGFLAILALFFVVGFHEEVMNTSPPNIQVEEIVAEAQPSTLCVMDVRFEEEPFMGPGDIVVLEARAQMYLVELTIAELSSYNSDNNISINAKLPTQYRIPVIPQNDFG